MENVRFVQFFWKLKWNYNQSWFVDATCEPLSWWLGVLSLSFFSYFCTNVIIRRETTNNVSDTNTFLGVRASKILNQPTQLVIFLNFRAKILRLAHLENCCYLPLCLGDFKVTCHSTSNLFLKCHQKWTKMTHFYLFIYLFIYFFGILCTSYPKISMFCVLSQSYQHLLKKWYKHLIVNCPRYS